MKLYSERAIDYMRSASASDRRYLLFNAIEKMTVTREGEKIVTLLSDTIAARGFENDMFFPMALLGSVGLPRLEGTVHVNMALSLKFMQNFMFRPADAGLLALQQLPVEYSPNAATRAVANSLRAAGSAVVPQIARIPRAPKALRTDELPHVGRCRDFVDDDFLFAQGPSRGLGRVAFADWRGILQGFAHLPNVAVFLKQANGFQTLLAAATPTAAQQDDVDFLFAIGELFTLLPYAQLIRAGCHRGHRRRRAGPTVRSSGHRLLPARHHAALQDDRHRGAEETRAGSDRGTGRRPGPPGAHGPHGAGPGWSLRDGALVGHELSYVGTQRNQRDPVQ
jgi:hypothetical protein